MRLELISFKLCPFVQRSVITLRYKQVPFDVTYIDLAQPPDWFRLISPFGKVPVLRIRRDAQERPAQPLRHGACSGAGRDPVIFESAVINEYLDEVTPGRLLPADPVCRAIDRSWIEFGTALMLDLSGMMHGASENNYNSAMKRVQEKLGWLEGILGDGQWFNGSDLSLVDVAYAPLFMRMRLLGLDAELLLEAGHPRLAAWSNRLLELPAVQESVVPDFAELLFAHIRGKAPYAADRLELGSL